MMTILNTTYTTLKTIFNTTLKTIFWMTLHTTSALAATLILTLLSDTLTEETTTTLKHLQTTAALYYNQLATETIRKHAYQPTSLWEANVQETIDLTLALAQQPQLVLLTVYLAAITAIIRYILILHLTKAQHHHNGVYLPPAIRILKLLHLVANLAAVLAASCISGRLHACKKPNAKLYSGFLAHLVLK